MTSCTRALHDCLLSGSGVFHCCTVGPAICVETIRQVSRAVRQTQTTNVDGLWPYHYLPGALHASNAANVADVSVTPRESIWHGVIIHDARR